MDTAAQSTVMGEKPKYVYNPYFCFSTSLWSMCVFSKRSNGKITPECTFIVQ